MEPDRWLGVELRHFLALEAVAREGSFGKAAIALGYTQSAVSQQIAMLERQVGQKLVERPGGPKPVSLTEAGRLLLTHAAAIAARVAAAQADLSALGDGEAGSLHVGVFQSVGQRILPALMRRFMASWPKVEVTLTESADDRELLALVERGELDLTFSDLPLEEGPFESVELLRDPYVLVVPADADIENPSLREIAQLDLIGHKHCRTLVETSFFGAGLNHGVLAAHVVDRRWFRESLADPPKNIEVRQGGFNQKDVRAFVDIERDLAQSFLGVRAIHLVGTPITKLRRAFRRFSKRSVKRRGEFSRVTHDARLLESILIQGFADRADPREHRAGGLLQQVLALRRQRRVVEPAEVGLELFRRLGRRFAQHERVAA